MLLGDGDRSVIKVPESTARRDRDSARWSLSAVQMAIGGHTPMAAGGQIPMTADT